MGIFKKSSLPPYHPAKKPPYPGALSSDGIRGVYSNCFDLGELPLYLGGDPAVRAQLFFIDGLIATADVSLALIAPLTDALRLGAPRSEAECIDLIANGAAGVCAMRRRTLLSDAADDLARGCAVLVFDAEKTAFSFELKLPAQRSVGEPGSEKSIKGAKDAFIENLRINTALVRRKLASPALKLEQSIIGRKSRTAAALMYVDGIADPALAAEARRRLSEIDVAGVLTTAEIEEALADSPRSPFPQLIHTERPDKFALNLLEGRVGVIIDGLPYGFLAPATLPQLLKVPEDASNNFVTASLITILRYVGLFITVLLPGLYVAVALYHQEMIPTKLLISIIDSKQQVPFSTFIEILAMLLAFELLQEAGLRLPDPIGQTVSIIGALIVGQSAVEARVVSPIAVIVVALAGISGYTCPSADLGSVLRLMRLGCVFAAMAGGMYGIMCALAALLWHLCSLESFGVPYLSPLTEGGLRAAVRAMMRPPLGTMKTRDGALHTGDVRMRR